MSVSCDLCGGASLIVLGYQGAECIPNVDGTSSEGHAALTAVHERRAHHF